MGRPGENSPQNQSLPQPPTSWQIFTRGAKYAIATLGITGTIGAILIFAGVITTSPIGWLILGSAAIAFAGLSFLYAWKKSWDEYDAARAQQDKALPKVSRCFSSFDLFSCFGLDFCKEQTLGFTKESDDGHGDYIAIPQTTTSGNERMMPADSPTPTTVDPSDESTKLIK